MVKRLTIVGYLPQASEGKKREGREEERGRRE
jgi:hypothetical protein